MSDPVTVYLTELVYMLSEGASGVDYAHVFISSGENVRLPCNNALSDCKSTTWIYNRHSAAVKLIDRGIKKKDTERHERLSLGSDCSLNITNVIEEDYGSYTCQQWTDVNKQKQRNDTRVYLHVLHDHCIITLTTTLLNEDDNREWRCQLTLRNQLQTSVRYTVKYSVIVIVVASFAVLLPALILWMIRRKRDDNRRGTDDSEVRCDDKVTYASIRGAKAGSQENCSELYASVNKNHHKSVK
ncbi:hypothetical protein DPX16_1218 [Anabarilius grahami]|uniref:Ig-like domain-containing protein n=1 Tax=Anabarilius grahami TaxID=495550 RepID=A0A3N0XVD0_ANAGA|nr:hypothetical protein DPX16_1218 [Anabarilius grahami]